MSDIKSHTKYLTTNDYDSPYTSLFSLLKQYKDENGRISLAYDDEILAVMQNHIDNAVTSLLTGVQEIGFVISSFESSAKLETQQHYAAANLGLLISNLANLIEALNILKSDTTIV